MTSAGVVLDTAALRASTLDSPAQPPRRAVPAGRVPVAPPDRSSTSASRSTRTRRRATRSRSPATSSSAPTSSWRRRRACPRRRRAVLAGLRRLAGQLRRCGDRSRRPHDGAVRGVDLRPLAPGPPAADPPSRRRH